MLLLLLLSCIWKQHDKYPLLAHCSVHSTKPTITNLRVWGCIIYVKVPSPKKSEDRVVWGYFMGFTKRCLLIHWLDPSSEQVKHTFTVKFDKHCTPMSTTGHIPPSSLLLTNTASPVNLPEIGRKLSNQPTFDAPIFQLYLVLPPQGTPVGCTITSCSYNNLPYFTTFVKGSSLATSLSKYGPPNSTFWILSIQNQEFNIQLKQQPLLLNLYNNHLHPPLFYSS